MLAPVDLEAPVAAYLTGRLGAEVSTRVPNPRPATFVRITRAGGQARNLVQSDVRLLVECWAPDETSAFDLARYAYAYLWAAAFTTLGEVRIQAIELTEPVNYPDPTIPDQDRYQFIATATCSLAQLPDPPVTP